MSDTCETVLIKSDEMGSVRINASDFDPSKHDLFGDDTKPEVKSELAASEGVGTDSGDQLSDDQLRAAIETATGERPHHRTGRDKLVSMFNELNKAA